MRLENFLKKTIDISEDEGKLIRNYLNKLYFISSIIKRVENSDLRNIILPIEEEEETQKTMVD